MLLAGAHKERHLFLLQEFLDEPSLVRNSRNCSFAGRAVGDGIRNDDLNVNSSPCANRPAKKAETDHTYPGPYSTPGASGNHFDVQERSIATDQGGAREVADRETSGADSQPAR